MKLTVRRGFYYFTDGTGGRRVQGYVHNLYARYCGCKIVPVTEKSLAWRLSTEIFEAIHKGGVKRYTSAVAAIRQYAAFRHQSGTSPRHTANLVANLARFVDDCGIETVGQITESIIAVYLERLDVHPHTKNKHLSAIQGFCKYSKKHNWLSSIPTRDIDRYPERDRRIGRIISNDELLTLTANTDHFFAAVIWFAAATGLRRGEIMYLWRTGWSNVDLERHEYTLPAAATKSRRNVVNPLSPAAIEAARAIIRLAPRQVWSRDAFTQKFIRLCRSVGIRARFHDLRHTFNARLGKLAISPGTRARLMNQSTPDLSESRYHHDSLDDLHDIVNKLATS